MTLELLTYYLIAINFIAFAAFGLDKARAEAGQWRIREDTLLTLAFLGGFPGALAGRRLFRHKTRKASFTAALWRVPFYQLLFVVGGGIATDWFAFALPR